MNCPVTMTDYTSALIGADWYEECGNQTAADQIRLQDQPRHNNNEIGSHRIYKLSGSSTRITNGLQVSVCKFGLYAFHATRISSCRTSKYHFDNNLSKSRSKAQITHSSRSSSRSNLL